MKNIKDQSSESDSALKYPEEFFCNSHYYNLTYTPPLQKGESEVAQVFNHLQLVLSICCLCW